MHFERYQCARGIGAYARDGKWLLIRAVDNTSLLDCPRSNPVQVQGKFLGPGPGLLKGSREMVDLDLTLGSGSRSGPGLDPGPPAKKNGFKGILPSFCTFTVILFINVV